MPTYEYGCSECHHEWEESQRITAPATEVCPKCGKTSAHRLISAGTNFILKGGGWYSDLYSSQGSSAKKSEEKKSEETSAPKGEAAKADAPATKTEASSTPSTSTSTAEKAA